MAFTGDQKLLQTVNSFQDYLVDKTTGAPLAAGTITCYQDQNRTILKNWYYQSGNVTDGYTFEALDNPLTLSSVGTVTDPNGNDVLPFFYPYDESSTTTSPQKQAYYVTIDNSAGTRQETRENFPFVPAPGSTAADVSDYNSILINGEFYDNVAGGTGSYTISGTDTVIAPSQHVGFSMPDIRFIKDVNDGTDVLTFTQFATTTDSAVLNDNVTPQWYLNYTCTNAGTSTYKYIQIPLQLHLKSLSQAQGTFTVQMQAGSTSINNIVTIKLYAFYGTGVSTPSQSVLATKNLSNTWTKYTISVPFDDFGNVTVSNTGDDAFYLQLGFPVNKTFNINIALPKFYLGQNAATTSFQTQDQVAAVTNSSRTGDIRETINTVVPKGWVALNDGTIGYTGSGATARQGAETWPLFNLLWNYNSTYVPTFTSAGQAVARGASAYADFITNTRQIALPRSLGKVIAGQTSQLAAYYTSDFTTSVLSNTDLTLTSASVTASAFSTGTPVYLTNSGGSLPTRLSTGVVYYTIVSTSLGATVIQLAENLENAMTGVPVNFDGGTGSPTNHITILNNTAAFSRGIEKFTLTESFIPQMYITNPATGKNISSNAVGGATYDSLPISGGTNNDDRYFVGTASNSPLDLFQPSIYMNRIIKL